MTNRQCNTVTIASELRECCVDRSLTVSSSVAHQSHTLVIASTGPYCNRPAAPLPLPNAGADCGFIRRAARNSSGRPHADGSPVGNRARSAGTPRAQAYGEQTGRRENSITGVLTASTGKRLSRSRSWS